MRHHAIVLFVILLFLPLLSCDRLIDSGTVEVPIVPISLPIYPTDISAEGLADSVAGEMDGLEIPSYLQPSKSKIQGGTRDLEDKLKDASVEILQPGVLSISVKSQVTDLIRQGIEVTRVGVKIEIANDTPIMAACPVEFKIYLGDAAKAEAWDESVSIQFADEKVKDGVFVVEPGRTVALEINDVPHIADALNNAAAIGVGYKAIYRMADADAGADVQKEAGVFGECVLALCGVPLLSTDSCPSASQLIGWHLTLKKFALVISAKAKFDVPKIPTCKEFADAQKLDLLGKECK